MLLNKTHYWHEGIYGIRDIFRDKNFINNEYQFGKNRFPLRVDCQAEIFFEESEMRRMDLYMDFKIGGGESNFHTFDVWRSLRKLNLDKYYAS